MSKAFTSEETPDVAVTSRPAVRVARGQERPITAEGYRALQDEAQALRGQQEPAVLARLALLEATLENVRVVDLTDATDGHARFGAHVTVRWSDGRQQRVRLVGPDEADAKAGTVSVSSPLGRALVGHAVGDAVEFERPGGALEGEVVAVG